MSYQPLVPATLSFNSAGIPWTPVFDDVYHSDCGGLEQARHVFLAGNDLPKAWQGREQFVILETGFGLGLNFLATWRAWRDDPQRASRLHFVSVEKHPFARADLAGLHRNWPELESCAQQLENQWPPLTPGVHRLHFDDDRVTLTLLFGDAAAQIRKLALAADALYLDGFAPSKNPELWDKPFLKAVTRLCKPGATLATWTVAAAVREALVAQRWAIEKLPGFGTKRDMLRGQLHGTSVPSTPSKHAMVIGAGIAGCAIAERLGCRGWRIEVLERRLAPAMEASGNPAGLLHPMLARDDNLAARFSRAGYLYSLRLLAQLDNEDRGLRWNRCGVLQLARDAAQEAAQRATWEGLRFPLEYVDFHDRPAAKELVGSALAAGGWYYPEGAIVNPPSLCNALLARHREMLVLRFDAEVAALHRSAGHWLALDRSGKTLAAAPIVVVANGHDVQALLPQSELPISRLRGQVSMLPPGALPFLRHALCGNGYATPDTLGANCIGATFDMDDDDPQPREKSHRFNLARLAELLPSIDIGQFDAAALQGRVGLRPIASDRMPIVGALPDRTSPLRSGAQLRDVPRLPGLQALVALGSRGLTWAPLCAELIAARLNDEPLPIERDLIAAIDPARFAIRAQRRASVSIPRDL